MSPPSESDLPDEIGRAVDRLVQSLDSLEVLVLLCRHGEQPRSADDVAQELGISAASATRELERFHALGVAAADPAGGGGYLLDTSGPLADEARRIAQAYGSRRIAMINHVASRALGRIRSLADAFRLKKGDDE